MVLGQLVPVPLPPFVLDHLPCRYLHYHCEHRSSVMLLCSTNTVGKPSLGKPQPVNLCRNFHSALDIFFSKHVGDVAVVKLSLQLTLMFHVFRLYNIGLKSGPKLVKVFTIGPRPAGSLGQTVLDSFGDAAVDFTPTPGKNLLILSGNGDVYIMQSELDNNR